MKTIIGLTGAVALGVAALALASGEAVAEEAVLYKNPQCGCCENASSATAGTGRAEEPDHLDEGRTLYLENCATCHGEELEGQPDWQSRLSSGRLPAPPHDAAGHTWHHPDSLLFEITKYGPAAVVGGGYESDMPAFDDILSDAEIRAVLEYIKSTWPARERRYQADRTRAEQEASQGQ